MALTDTQLERYARHIILKEIGGAGQVRLLHAHVIAVHGRDLAAEIERGDRRRRRCA